jgi:hypothetical protein
MTAHTRILSLSALALVASLGSAVASAQAWNGGGSESIGQSTSPAMLNSTVSSEEVLAGAMAAARPTGTESIGQSTAMPARTSNVSRDEVYQGAVAASHQSGTESIGQSTAMPMPSGS